MKNQNLIVIIAFLLVVAACKKSDIEPTNDTGAPFKYISLLADEDTIANGAKTKITANATGSNLTFNWEGPVGIIAGSGKEVFFFACCPGDHFITCTVKDKAGNTDSKTINIYAY